MLGVSLITSKGADGVPGSAIVILAAMLNAVPSIPAIGLVLMLSVDWFIGMARAVSNLVGNCIATVVWLPGKAISTVPRRPRYWRVASS